jgi:putative GTP pyrophosphokinase
MTETETQVLSRFLEQYERYVKDVLQPAQVAINALLSPWVEPEHWEKYKRTERIPIPTPVKTTYSRIKRPEQVVDKILRQPHKFTAGLVPESFELMEDTIGFRSLVYFLSHLPLIDRELRSMGAFEISTESPPVAYLGDHQPELLSLDHLIQWKKQSGYCSVHYTLRLADMGLPLVRRPWFELQVRTLTMELWSTMEHHLGYKPARGTHIAAKRQFKLLATMLGAIDEHFNFLYEELNRYQEELEYEDSDLLSPENLPSVLGEAAISCAQRDINNILKFFFSRGVETIGDLRDLATPHRLEKIRNTYLAVTGRPPQNLEVIACVAAIRGATTGEEETQRIRGQIAYRGAWDSIRQELTTEQR